MYAYENIEMSLNYIEQHLSEKIETEKLPVFLHFITNACLKG